MLVRPLNGAPVPHPVPDANWGLHLTDANIALGDNVALVQRQFRAWERKNAAKYSLRAWRRPACPSPTGRG